MSAPPLRTHALVLGALLGLLAVTVGAAWVDLGKLNLPVALAVAGVKAALVAAFFMHLRGSSRLLKVSAVVGLAWLAILIGLVMEDFATRGDVPREAAPAPVEARGGVG